MPISTTMSQANTMNMIEEVYEETQTEITYEEFEQRVEDKMEQMGGLVDTKSASLLIQNEVEESTSTAVDQIHPDDSEVEFTAKIVGIGKINTFDQSDSDSDENSEEDSQEGRVCNITLRDKTGAIRAALWNKMADNAVMEYEVGDTVTIQGSPREGYNGVEVNVSSIEATPDVEIDLDVNEVTEIRDLTKHHEMVDISGIVLGKSSINSFDRDDGSTGKVSNIVIGDGSGDIVLTLWDEATEAVSEVSREDTIQVLNGNVRHDEESGDVVIHTGSPEAIRPIDAEFEYSPDSTTSIDSVQENDVVTIKGTASVVEDINEFTRDDGSEGRVQNIEIKDNTGSIRVALWGEDTREDLQPGTSIALINAEIEEGWQDQLEAKISYKSALWTLSEDVGKQEADPTSIGEYNGSDNTDKETEPQQEDSVPDTTDTEEPQNGEDVSTGTPEVEVTGVVVGTGEKITLDASGSDETIHPPEDNEPRLGESITVRGTRTEDGTIEANEIF